MYYFAHDCICHQSYFSYLISSQYKKRHKFEFLRPWSKLSPAFLLRWHSKKSIFANVKSVWHLLWKRFWHSCGANQIKIDFQTFNLYNSQSINHKSINFWDWICPTSMVKFNFLFRQIWMLNLVTMLLVFVSKRQLMSDFEVNWSTNKSSSLLWWLRYQTHKLFKKEKKNIYVQKPQ